MKRVDQTVFTIPGGNCFSACVASILEIDLADVPYFMGESFTDDGSWWDRFTSWLTERGMRADYYVPGQNIDISKAGWPDEPYIATGRTPRDCPAWRAEFVKIPWPEHEPFLHSVVYASGELIHDPHPSRAGILGDVTDFVLMRRIA